MDVNSYIQDCPIQTQPHTHTGQVKNSHKGLTSEESAAMQKGSR